jgi:hypothetical protein
MWLHRRVFLGLPACGANLTSALARDASVVAVVDPGFEYLPKLDVIRGFSVEEYASAVNLGATRERVMSLSLEKAA